MSSQCASLRAGGRESRIRMPGESCRRWTRGREAEARSSPLRLRRRFAACAAPQSASRWRCAPPPSALPAAKVLALGGEDKESCASVHTMMMPTHVHVIDLKRWFIECHIFMPKKAFDYGKTEIYKIIHVDPDVNFSYVGHTTNFVQRKKKA